MLCVIADGQLTAISFPLSDTTGPMCSEALIKDSVERYTVSANVYEKVAHLF
jgi:hypothetical protein